VGSALPQAITALGIGAHQPLCGLSLMREANSGNGLRSSQVLPRLALTLHLEHTTLIRMQEVVAIGDAVRALGLHDALRPTSRDRPSPVLPCGSHHVDAVIDTILDTCWSSRDQPPASQALMTFHTDLDAPAVYLVPS
jgi:hypothetical protein